MLASGGIGTDATLVPQEAMRLVAGQTMYRDFYASFGPISAFVYLPFLLVAPTGGWAHLLASGALNAAGAFCVWAILRRCALPRLHTLLGGALTGCWFSAQFGGVLYDYISFLFVLGAAVVYASPKDTARRGLAIGVLVALGLLTKQTTGPLATLALIAGAFAADGTALFRSRVLHWALLGCGATFGCVYGVIAAYGVWADYVEAVFVLPFGFRSDPSKHPLRLLLVWLVPFLIDPIAMLREFGLGRLLFYPAVLVIYAAYYTAFRKWTTFFAELPTRRFAFVFFVCSTLLCSSVFARLFTNLTWGLWGALMLVCAAWRLERRTVWASAALFFGIAGVQSWKRMRFFDESTLTVPAHHDFRPVRVVDWPELAYGTALRGATNLMTMLPNGGIGTPSYAFIDDGLSLLPLAIGTAPSNWPTEYVDGQTLPREPGARHAWQLEFIKQLESTRTEWVFSAFDAMPYPLRDPTLSGTEAWNSLPVLRDYLSCAYTNHGESHGVRLSKRKSDAHCEPHASLALNSH